MAVILAEPICTAALSRDNMVYRCLLAADHDGVHRARGASGTFIIATWDEFVPGAHHVENV